MKSRVAVMVLVGALGIVGNANAADAGVPQTIDQQGRFLKIDGTPETGSLMVTYAIYADATTTTNLWSETQTLALDTSGFYSTQLGAHTAFPSGLWNGAPRYLGITISGESEMTPRTSIVSVPYALVAGDVLGDIHPASITVNGKTIVDSTGTIMGGGGGAGFPAHPFSSDGGQTNGSLIISDAQATQINTWAGTPFATWSKCYGFGGPANSGGNNNTFHTDCDGKAPLVVVAQFGTSTNPGNILGGFTPVPTLSTGGTYGGATTSFLYSFGPPASPIAKHYPITGEYYAYGIENYTGFAIGFGYGSYDLLIDLTDGNFACDFPYSYSCNGKYAAPTQACTTELCGSGVTPTTTRTAGVYQFEAWYRN